MKMLRSTLAVVNTADTSVSAPIPMRRADGKVCWPRGPRSMVNGIPSIRADNCTASWLVKYLKGQRRLLRNCGIRRADKKEVGEIEHAVESRNETPHQQ